MMEKVALFERKTTAYYFYSAVASVDVAVAVLAPTKEIHTSVPATTQITSYYCFTVVPLLSPSNYPTVEMTTTMHHYPLAADGKI